MNALTIEQTLTAARNGVTKSRAASQRAKTHLDAGYPHRAQREIAIEELRLSVEQLIEVVERLLSDEKNFPLADIIPEVESEIEERRR